MRDYSSTGGLGAAIRQGVLVLSGYGLRVSVERGHLVCSDGYCDVRRRLRLHRATSGLRRLVQLGTSGIITLEAVRWLHGIGAGLVQLTGRGEVLLASGPPGLDDARLRRAQATAPTRDVGLRITRDLLRAKLLGQARVLDRLAAPAVAATLRRACGALDRAPTLERMRSIEAESGMAYWEAWRAVPVRFARRDERVVPDHWTVAGTRSSPLTGQPRRAVSPAHAILNYLYAVLESEARIATQAVGLDPGMGILHADQPARDSFALDLMEPVRPSVDAFALDLLRERVFSRDDFVEDEHGVCALVGPLRRDLAQTGPLWAKEIGPWAERAAALLAESARRRERPIRVPTPLTQANRSAGRSGIRRRPPRTAMRPRVDIPRACLACGAIIEGAQTRARYCAACLPDVKRAISEKTLDLARLAKALKGPVSEETRTRLGRATAAASRERRRWEEAHPDLPDPAEFRTRIAPLLATVPVRQLARLVGLSIPYIAAIKRGERTPHPRHWERIEETVRALLGRGGEDAMPRE